MGASRPEVIRLTLTSSYNALSILARGVDQCTAPGPAALEPH